jgi:threonine dehydrogenase-like Zn-dependent dehydrogenase
VSTRPHGIARSPSAVSPPRLPLRRERFLPTSRRRFFNGRRVARPHGRDPRHDRIARGEITTSHLATHVMSLDEGPRGYDLFKNKEDGCVRAVFRP